MTSKLTDLKSQLVGVSPEVEDHTADCAQHQRQPHVHSGGGVHGAHYQQDPDTCYIIIQACGTVVLRFCGTVVLWFCGSVVL